MIDLLLINPGELRYQRLADFKKQGLNCKVVLTSGFEQNAGYVLAEDIVRADNITKVTSAIGFASVGLGLLEKLNLSNKITLGNSKSKEHIEKRAKYHLGREALVGDWMLEFVSYKGRHVLCHAMFYNPAYGWKMIARNKQDLPFFSTLVEDAVDFLDDLGILNGPNQVNFSNTQEFNLRPFYGGKTISKSQKLFDTAWLLVLEKEKIDPRLALTAFYAWAERFGPSKRFELKPKEPVDVSEFLEFQTSNPIQG
jgi:hypothetical protein